MCRFSENIFETLLNSKNHAETETSLIKLSTFVSDAFFVLQEALMSQQRQVAGYNLAADTSPSLSAYVCNKARRTRKNIYFTFYNFAVLYISKSHILPFSIVIRQISKLIYVDRIIIS